MTETERADRAELALGTLQTALREVTLERDKANAAADRYCSQWIDVLKAAKSVVPAEAAVGTLQTALRQHADAAEMLWVVLANVSGGDWTKQSDDWQEAAARWRDNYFAALTVYQTVLPALEPTP